MKKRIGLLVCTMLGVTTAVFGQATPPDQFNYQGVLRDSAGNALSGNHSMAFRLFGTSAGGSSIVGYCRDPLCVASSECNCVGLTEVGGTDGLFTVAIGDPAAGGVMDGPGPGFYSSFSQAFRDFSSLFLEVEVDGEILAPRTRITSAGYAMNADYLDGRNASAFPLLSASNNFTTGTQTINTGGTAITGLIVRGSPAQTANLQEWQITGGGTLAFV